MRKKIMFCHFNPRNLYILKYHAKKFYRETIKQTIKNIITKNGVKKKARKATDEQKTIWWLYAIL